MRGSTMSISGRGVRASGGRPASRRLRERARTDPLGHRLRLLAVHGAVLELDPRVLVLARRLDGVGAVAALRRPRGELVLDARLVELALDLPAGVHRDLHPDVLAPVELDRHAVPSSSCDTFATSLTGRANRRRDAPRWIR